MFRQHTSSVRRKDHARVAARFDSRTDLWSTNRGLACTVGATDPCKIGVVGSTPIRSTAQIVRACGPTGRHRVRRGGNPGSIPGGSTGKTELRKVAGYGWPGRGANAVLLRGDEGSSPLPSAFAPMVKRRSCLVSTEVFRVRVLVGVLENLFVERRVPYGERSVVMQMPRTGQRVSTVRY